jgi:hypothetical protein
VSDSRWANRIIETVDAEPTVLAAHDENFREHSDFQREAMTGVLDEIGWVGPVIVSKKTGRILDGHMRVELAIERGEKLVPVAYVDVDEDEERKILATFDPLGSLARENRERSSALRDRIQANSETVRDLIAKQKPSGKAPMRKLDVKKTPAMAWVLIGVPVLRFGKLTRMVREAAKIEGALVETTVTDDNED